MTKILQTASIFEDIQKLIESTKFHVATYANSALVLLYWQIGIRLNQDFLKDERAEYGMQILKNLGQELTSHYGSGFDYPNLTRMIRFSKLYQEQQIVVTLSQQLSWSHFVRLISIEEDIKRNFYIQMCQHER